MDTNHGFNQGAEEGKNSLNNKADEVKEREKPEPVVYLMYPDYDLLPEDKRKEIREEIIQQERTLVDKVLRRKYPNFEIYSEADHNRLRGEVIQKKEELESICHNWKALPFWKREDLIFGIEPELSDLFTPEELDAKYAEARRRSESKAPQGKQSAADELRGPGRPQGNQGLALKKFFSDNPKIAKELDGADSFSQAALQLLRNRPELKALQFKNFKSAVQAVKYAVQSAMSKKKSSSRKPRQKRSRI